MPYAVLTPDAYTPGLGSFPFARRYLGNRCFFLFLSLLRCFSSGGSLCIPMYSVCSDRGLLCRVSPFRNPRVNGYLLLTVAYRSLSRLSSALSAKASTLRPFLLNLRSAAISCGLVLKMSFRSWRFISVGLKFYMLSHVHDFSCALLLS